MGAQGQRPLAPPLFATRGGYTRRQLPLSLSLSVSLTRSVQLTLYNNNIHTTSTQSMCPKSYLYIYDLWHTLSMWLLLLHVVKLVV